MGKVDTNTIGLKFADEASVGTAPASGYVQTEPNEIGNFGASVTITPRAPISVNRQRRRGAVTDLEASVSYTEDLTFSAFRSWAERSMFALAKNRAVIDIEPSAVTAGASGGFTVTANAARAALLNFAAAPGANLLWADGFDASANNGLHVMAADLLAAGTNIRVDDLVADTSPDGFVSLAGFRIVATVSKTLTYSDADKTLTLAAANIGAATATGANLTPGQLVHIGSIPSSGGALQNGARSGNAGAPAYGYARVRSVAAGSIVLDKVDATLQRTFAANDEEELDIVYGEFIRNVATTDADFNRTSRTMELESPDLGDVVATVQANVAAGAAPIATSVANLAVGNHVEIRGTRHRISAIAANGALTLQPVTTVALLAGDDIRKVDDYEYAVGLLVNTLTLNMPLTDKSTMEVAMIGSDVQAPGQQEGQSTNSGAPRAGDGSPRKTSPFNTTSDFARLRVTELDEDALTTDFKSLTVAINNNLTGEKVLAFLGNKFVNLGNLFVDLTAQVIFSSPRIPRAIRDNTVLRADAILANDDGVIGIDIPSLTLGGGGREYPVNQAVLVNATIESFADADLDTSVGISVIHVPIPA